MKPFLRRFSLLHRLSLTAAAGALFLAAAASAVADPVMTAGATPVAINGETLVINGFNFDATPANNTVQFNDGAAGTVAAATTTSLSVTLTTAPASTGGLTAVVTTDGQSSGAPVQVAVVEPVVQFSATSGTVNATDGTFSVPVAVTGNPSFASGASGTVSTLWPANGSDGLAIDGAGNFYVGTNQQYETVTKITSAGVATQSFYYYNNPNSVAVDAAGNLYVSFDAYNTVIKVKSDGSYTFVGSGLNSPMGMAFDAAGNIYVANYSGNTVSKVTPAGVTTTFASGFNYPSGLACDASGNVYVGNRDQNGQGIVSLVTPAGVVSTFVSGLTSPSPAGLAVDSAGNLYVPDADQSGNGIVRRVTPSGAMSTIASGLYYPKALAFDAAGILYVLNYDPSFTLIISKVVPTMTVPLTLGGTAVISTDYTGVASPLTIVPGQTTVNITGTLLPDPGVNRTLTFTLGAPTGGMVGASATSALTILEPAAAALSVSDASLPINAPSIVLQGSFNPVAANNTVTFSDGAVGTVTSATASTLTVTFTTPPAQLGSLTATVVTNGTSTGAPVQVATVVPAVSSTTSGVALNATTFTITGAGFDPIAANNTVTFNNGAVGIVTKATATQLTVTLTTPPTTVGPLTAVVTTDGQSSGLPITVATMLSSVQFSVGSESVDATTGAFSIPVTLTGNPTFTNGVSPYVHALGAEFSNPTALAFDAAGNFYVANFGGSVTKVVPGGAYSTFATGFTTIAGLVCDAAGNLYVADRAANTVSQIMPGGAVSVFASGFNAPTKMVFDTAGNLYVANAGNGVINEVTPGGVVSTFASGFPSPDGLVFDRAGNLYVANSGNGTVSLVTPGGVASTFASGLNSPVGVGFDAQGNLLVASINNSGGTIGVLIAQPAGIIIIGNPTPPNGSIFQVSPNGVVSSFATSLLSPTDLVSDTAGNIYITNEDLGYNEYGGHNGLLTEFSPSATVNFTIGGTAVNGVDYSQISNSSAYGSTTLTFIAGQPTLYITGTLLSNTGVPPALTFTLGTPNGAVIGTPATNTLTILEPTLAITTSTASLPINASTITLNGYFSPVAANDTVTFNHGAVGTVTTAGSSSLTVTFSTPPQSLGPLTASVTSNGRSSGTPVTVATIVPGVTSSSSTLSLNGNVLTISGFGFDPIAAHNTVVLSNGLTGTVTSATATKLTVSLAGAPAHTGNIYATVTTDGLSSVASVAIGTVEPTVQFSAGSESVNATAGTFSIPVTLTGNPTFDSGVAPAFSTIASGYTLGNIYPSAIAFDAAGSLYLANSHDGVVTKFNPDGSNSVFASGFTTPFAIAFDSTGNLFLADHGTGNISEITPAGVISTYLTGYNYLDSLAFDAAGNLYVAYVDENYNGFIDKVTPAKVVTNFASGFYYPSGLVFDAAGNLYVDSMEGGPLYQVTPAGVVNTLVPSVDAAGGMTIDAAGNIYLSDYYDAKIYEITPGGVVRTLLAVNQPEGLAFDAEGHLFAVNHLNNTGTISEFFPTALVPFTLGGTGVAGTDYSGVTASPLVFVKGQPTASITGSLNPDSGVNPTLTFTLGTPQGALLGSPATNTLTIAEGPISVASSTANLAIDAPTIVIQGVFNPVVANNTVTFNDGAVGTVTSASASSLTVTFTTTPQNTGALTATVLSKGVSTGPIQVATIVPSVTDATLKSLAVTGTTLSPVFARSTTNYTATVSFATTSITITPTVDDPAAGVSGNIGTQALSVGSNTLSIVVTAENGNTQTYTIVITRLSPPTVLNSGATFAATTATVSGTVNAEGFNTTVSFDYGPTTAYGKTATTKPALVTGSLDTPITVALTGLLPATQYHYQFKAVNAQGTATGSDGSFTTDNNVATLSKLILGSGTLSPVFKSTTLAYTTTVTNGTQSITITPTATDPNAKLIAVNGVSVTSGAASSPVNLTVGTNVINVVVTAQDGLTLKTYTLTVKRTALPPQMSTVAATNVTTTTATLHGTGQACFASTALSFDYGTTSSYGLTAVAAPTTISDDTITSTSVSLSGLKSGTTYYFRAKGVNVGGTGTGGGLTFRTISTVATLASLKPSIGTLSPAFASTTTAYTLTVPTATTALAFTPTVTTGSNAAVTVNGNTATSGSPSAPINLSLGVNSIPIVVTAEDGITTKTYTVTVVRSTPPTAVTGNATFAAVTATLQGTVNAEGTSTTVSFNYGTTATYGKTAAVPATVTGGNTTAVTAKLSGLLPATLYHFQIKAVSTAGTTLGGDNSFTTDNNVATLSNLTLSSGTLSPVFKSTTLAYTTTVTNGTQSITLTPTTTDPNAKLIAVNGISVTSGIASNPINLAVGTNVINVVVTAQDSLTIKTYTLTVKRTALPPQVGTLAATNVTTTTATLHGTGQACFASTALSFDYGTTSSYGLNAVAAPTTISDDTITPMTVSLSGLKSGTTYFFRAKGVNVGGTGTDSGLTFRTISTVATLASLKPSTGTLSPAFASATTAYTLTVPTATATLAFTPTVTTGSNAAVTVGGNIAISGSPSTPVNLSLGVNNIPIVVTAEDGITTKTYTVTVVRSTPPTAVTGNATFAAITAALQGTANAEGTSTTVSFNYGTTAAYGRTAAAVPATVTGGNTTAVTAKLSGLLPATLYHFQIKAVSTAGTALGADNVFTTDNNVATLSNLTMSGGILSPSFNSTTLAYTATTSYTSVTVTPVVTDSHAQVTVDGFPATSGSPSTAINLSPGTNLIKVGVTAQDGITFKIYTLTIKQAAAQSAGNSPGTKLPNPLGGSGSGTLKLAEPSVAQASALPTLPTTSTTSETATSDTTSPVPTPEPIKARLTGPVANGGTLPGGSVTFAWDAGRGVSQYWLSAGSAVGQTDLYDGSQGLALSQSISLPTDGQEVYVTLQSLINGTWKANNYVFTAADTTTRAVLVTPAEGAVLTDSTLALTWEAVPGATQYWLSIGSTEEGTDLYDSDQGTALTQSVAVPADGRELFVTLKTNCNGVWTQSTRSLTATGTGAPVAAHITSPATTDSSVLPTGAVTFTWDAGTGVSEYRLSVGSSAIATNLYDASQGSLHTVTITLPDDGSPLYVILSSLIQGAWVANQYLYQAPVPP